jgi:D-glycero-D-manno-heptose 1,7-bisphosphate phosphatase
MTKKIDKASIAVFLDRDGTINEEVGYVNHIDRFILLPGAIEAIREINRAGLRCVVISNQSGVARGYFPESLVIQVHEKMKSILEERGGYFDGIYYCPHHPSEGQGPYRKDCQCRKPKIGMLKMASEELGIDLRRSYVVGDRMVDIMLAENAGSKGILVLTGYGKGELEFHGKKGPTPRFIAQDILDAVKWIIEDIKFMEDGD